MKVRCLTLMDYDFYWTKSSSTIFFLNKKITIIFICLENFNKEDAEEFLSEINMLKSIGKHKNIVQLLGCVTKTPPYMLIMELILTGNLYKYLHRLRKMWRNSRSEDSGGR